MRHVPFHIGEAEVATVVAIRQARMFEAKQVENGGVQVVHVDLAGERVMAELVGGAVDEAGLDAAAGEELREAAGVVIASGAVALGVGRASEFAAPPDQRVLEQTAPLQIGEEARDGLVRCQGLTRFDWLWSLL